MAGKSEAPPCQKKVALYLEAGTVIVECTEPEDHEGAHYDSAFCRGWQERE